MPGFSVIHAGVVHPGVIVRGLLGRLRGGLVALFVVPVPGRIARGRRLVVPMPLVRRGRRLRGHGLLLLGGRLRRRRVVTVMLVRVVGRRLGLRFDGRRRLLGR
ncbi:MAG TPA: hypothetical protein VMT85_07965 [Thermoanaerobaculia bacterium]|nr:hypothetical protein [Thermoanaerobaculia bacterium]